MSGNSIGKLFVVTTFGESHGEAIGAIIDGCPPGLQLSSSDFEIDIERRKTGKSKFTSQRKELDKVEILSGILDGFTTGTPIGLLIKNTNQRSKDYDEIKEKFRPGHADYTYFKKFGVRDYRGGGRSSARETVVRVAAGCIAKKYLKENLGMTIRGYVDQIGEIKAECRSIEWDIVNSNPFNFPELEKLSAIENLFNKTRKEGDSIGAGAVLIIEGVPSGLGDPIFDRLNAVLASAMFSIPAVKGVEFGSGFKSIVQKGSEHRDQISKEGFLSNNAGGILGGISSGQNIAIRCAIKPTSSILKEGRTINVDGEETSISTKGRHDPCVGIRAIPIMEAMAAIVLMDSYLKNFHLQRA